MKLRAHNCDITFCSKQTEEAFINNNHYQGYCSSNECYALKDPNGQIVEMMTFCKPRYNCSYNWELLRLCTKKDYQVLGGASKLLAAFIKRHPNESIVSYCNESLFNGKVYEALGFKKIATCKSYHYEKDGIKYHRSNFQRWKLEQLFPQYPRDQFTERRIMELEGYTRVEETQATWVLGEQNDKWYIYKISLENGAEYIGQHRYHDTSNDKYSGSGKILKAMQKKYKWTKEILIDDIDNQIDADKYERCAIAISRLSSYNINICNGGHGYIGNGVRGEWDRDTNRERCSLIAKTWISKLSDEERIEKFGKHNKGRTAWNKGVTPSKEAVDKQRNSLNKYYETHAGPNKGKKFADDVKKKISASKTNNKDYQNKVNKQGLLTRSQVFEEFNLKTKLSLTQMKRFLNELNISAPYNTDTVESLIEYWKTKPHKQKRPSNFLDDQNK